MRNFSTFFMDFEEDAEQNTEVVRAKHVMDKSQTLSEAAEQLRCYAEHLLSLEREGWQLSGPITHDYGFIRRSPSDANA